MIRSFHSFVVLAGMRTGSNLLESTLNAVPGLHCHGEAFNPRFIGYPNRDSLLDMDLPTREADPGALLTAMRAQRGLLGGFRYFHDHDPRVLPLVLDDPGCAKIMLLRDPLESYVSLQIALQTGQWKLTNTAHRRRARIRFVPEEYEQYLAQVQGFRARIERSLMHSGQTVFRLGYDDLHDRAALGGLLQFLGVDAALPRLQGRLRKQNPEPLSEKVENYPEMAAYLLDHARLETHMPLGYEPPRGPGVRRYIAAGRAPLLYLPIPGAPEAELAAWLAALDGGPVVRGFNQKRLRHWKQEHPGHRSFTVIEHPLSRAHRVFCRHILPPDDPDYADLRATLRQRYGLPIPATAPGSGYDARVHRSAFDAFLGFLRANLADQTSLRVDLAWGTQSALLQGMAGLAMPDLVVRLDDMQRDLPALAARMGWQPVVPDMPMPEQPVALGEIYDDGLEDLARRVYARDYLQFGFGAWRQV